MAEGIEHFRESIILFERNLAEVRESEWEPAEAKAKAIKLLEESIAQYEGIIDWMKQQGYS